MPNWVSVGGKLFPKKEYYVNPNAKDGENPVYKGPDRGALDVLKEMGLEEQGFIGNDCRENDDALEHVRRLGFNSIEEYLKARKGLDFNKYIQNKELELERSSHEKVDKPVEPKTPIQVESGGRDWSGQGNHIPSGFGEPRIVTK